MLREFPSLYTSWLDEQGNTLLGLCVIHDYIYTGELLENKIVQKYIDFPSMDGLSPLMIVADYAKDPDRGGSLSVVYELIKNGADALFISRHSETVLHRAACSENNHVLFCLYACFREYFKFSTIVELRRKSDGATALQIALARGNCEAARCLIEKYGAKMLTRFGLSKTIRTPEAMLLKNNTKSLHVLKQEECVSDVRVILESAINLSLFEEESNVAATGLLDTFQDRRPPHIETESTSGALKFEDHSWQLLKIKNSKKYPWLKPLMRHKYDEVRNIIDLDRGTDDNGAEYYNDDECAVCLTGFDETPEMAKGSTLCNHVFHVHCWNTTVKMTFSSPNALPCPMCRTASHLTRIKTSAIIYDIEPAQASRKQKQVELDKILATGRRVFDHKRRYEFFVYGQWRDETSMSL